MIPIVSFQQINSVNLSIYFLLNTKGWNIYLTNIDVYIIYIFICKALYYTWKEYFITRHFLNFLALLFLEFLQESKNFYVQHEKVDIKFLGTCPMSVKKVIVECKLLRKDLNLRSLSQAKNKEEMVLVSVPNTTKGYA